MFKTFIGGVRMRGVAGATDLDVGLKLVDGSVTEDHIGVHDERGRRRRRVCRCSGAEQQAIGRITRQHRTLGTDVDRPTTVARRISRRHRTLGTDVGRPAIVTRTPFPVGLGGRPVTHGRDAVRERVRQPLPSARRR